MKVIPQSFTYISNGGSGLIELGVIAPTAVRILMDNTGIGMSDQSPPPPGYLLSELYAPDDFLYQNTEYLLPNQSGFSDLFHGVYQFCRDAYEDAISMGLCDEQAQLLLPQGNHMAWKATGSITEYAEFYRRCRDNNLGPTCAEASDLIAVQIEPLFPITWEFLTEYRNQPNSYQQ